LTLIIAINTKYQRQRNLQILSLHNIKYNATNFDLVEDERYEPGPAWQQLTAVQYERESAQRIDRKVGNKTCLMTNDSC